MDAGPKQDLWNLLPVIIVLLLGAAYFAIMETAFSSASRIRLKAAADHGNRRAGQALYVLDHFDQAITTLLIGTNTQYVHHPDTHIPIQCSAGSHDCKPYSD